MQFQFPRLTPTVKKLLLVLGGAFVALAIVQNLLNVPAFQWLALDLAGASSAQYINWLWQPLTYWLVFPPVPDAFMSVVFTLVGIYFFLCPFEEAYGGKRSLQLAAVGVVAAVVPCLALSFVVDATHPIAGAAPIALAALGAFPVIARGREILFMFVLPMKSWTVILLGLGISALMAVLARDPYIFVEYAGALGGGVAFARWMTRPRTPKRPSGPFKKKRSGGPDLRVVRGGADDEKPRWLN